MSHPQPPPYHTLAFMATFLVAILFLHSLATPTLSHSNSLPSLPPLPSPLLPETNQTCPADSMKMHMCLDVLEGMIDVGIGPEVEHACCPVMMGMVGMEAAICICYIVRGSFMKMQFLIPMALQVLVYCGNAPPPGFVCPVPP